ncbi:MFS transporter [Azospirillum rugosum]|uniref:MFS family permease n=1 Tax=Azospirillum rugosum TaxID=416170 RepID=A0ABS4SMF8_9PROT|nr:MFS transporter [Azospirillum rugosum]MBP2293748.1 MFS family permease [Azospirillum rugosum]MDQ0527293.1 MFS family permease [Azospirillum rugosum]
MMEEARPQSGADDGRRIRWLLCASFFLATAADSSSNAFLPVFARALQPATPGLPADMAAGLPTAAYWLMVAAAQLTAGRWERGRDHRVLLVGALLLTALALALSGLAANVPMLTLWRGLGGFGAGVTMILVQDGLLRLVGAGARTRASGTYLGFFFAGTIAGTMAGGALAVAAGPMAAFLAAAAAAALAALAAMALPAHREATAPQPFRVRELLRNPAFVSLVLLGAVPSRLLIAAFLYCLVPLRLHDLGMSAVETGWVLTLYALTMALTAPPWSRLIDRSGRPFLFTIIGLALSAAAMATVPAAGSLGIDGLVPVVAAVALLGTAQALGMAPQVTVLFRVTPGEMERFGRTPVLGLFRVFERLGLFVGPLLATKLAGPGAASGPGGDAALIALAVLAAAAAVALTIALTVYGPSPAKPEIIR